MGKRNDMRAGADDGLVGSDVDVDVGMGCTVGTVRTWVEGKGWRVVMGYWSMDGVMRVVVMG